MNVDEVLAHFDRQLRREARPDGPGVVVERAGDVVRQVGPGHAWNGVLWSDLDEDRADAAIAEQVRHYGGLGLAFEWKLYSHDRPADLGSRLLAAGFTPEPAEALMVAESARIAAEYGTTGTPSGRPSTARPSGSEDGVRAAAEFGGPEGVWLVPVTDPGGVEMVAAVHENAFGESREHIRERLLDQLATGTLSAVVAMAGDVPVSAARMDPHPGTRFASLWGGGTAPEWRGKGIYRALVAYRARQAVALGYDYLQVDASDQSRPILARLGFAELATTTPYVHS